MNCRCFKRITSKNADINGTPLISMRRHRFLYLVKSQHCSQSFDLLSYHTARRINLINTFISPQKRTKTLYMVNVEHNWISDSSSTQIGIGIGDVDLLKWRLFQYHDNTCARKSLIITDDFRHIGDKCHWLTKSTFNRNFHQTVFYVQPVLFLTIEIYRHYFESLIFVLFSVTSHLSWFLLWIYSCAQSKWIDFIEHSVALHVVSIRTDKINDIVLWMNELNGMNDSNSFLYMFVIFFFVRLFSSIGFKS